MQKPAHRSMGDGSFFIFREGYFRAAEISGTVYRMVKKLSFPLGAVKITPILMGCLRPNYYNGARPFGGLFPRLLCIRWLTLVRIKKWMGVRCAGYRRIGQPLVSGWLRNVGESRLERDKRRLFWLNASRYFDNVILYRSILTPLGGNTVGDKSQPVAAETHSRAICIPDSPPTVLRMAKSIPPIGRVRRSLRQKRS